MTTVNVHQAKLHQSRLLAQVASGEEVVIVRNGAPVARLVPFRQRGKREFGALKGRLAVSETFFEPLPESEHRPEFSGRTMIVAPSSAVMPATAGRRRQPATLPAPADRSR